MEKILMTPGPTNIPAEVFNAMTQNIHHRTGEFLTIMKDMNGKLKKIFGSSNDIIPLLSSGTGGLEASIVNLFSPGDKLLCLSCGVFGERYSKIARNYGVDVYEYRVKWGYGIHEYELENELKRQDYKAVYATYSETSTGVKNDIKALGDIVSKYGALFIVDIVSALGSLQFSADDFKVDVAIAGSQKGLMCPPGLSLISMSGRAWEAVQKSTIPKFYFDFKRYMESEMMPFTPGISILLGLNKSLDMLLEQGIENVIGRHRKHSVAVKHACKLMGLKEVPDEVFRSEVLTAVYAPSGFEAKEIIRKMDGYGIVIAGGQGKFKGRIFRIGHMGYVTDKYIKRTIECLSKSLNDMGYENDTSNIMNEISVILGV